MNWNSISFDWNQARAFLAAAEERSLSAAADVLGVTQLTYSPESPRLWVSFLQVNLSGQKSLRPDAGGLMVE